MVKMVYKPAKGFHINEKQAQVYGERLTKLAEERGSITPEVALSDAKKRSSPLHDYFEWDNSIAGERYRLEQAGYLIRSIVVEIIDDGKSSVQTRQFYSVSSDTVEDSDPEVKQVYVTLNDVLTDTDKREQVVAYAWRELKGWETRYAQYSEFDEIHKVIRQKQTVFEKG